MSNDALRAALETCVAALEALQDEATEFPATISSALIEARAALARTEPGPVVWMDPEWPTGTVETADAFEPENVHPSLKWVPLYASPPSAQRVPLSDREVFMAVFGVDNFVSSLLWIARALERAHGIHAPKEQK